MAIDRRQEGFMGRLSDDLQDNDLHLSLIRLGRRLRLRDGWLLAQRSLWTAILAGLLILGLGRVRPVEQLELWALIPLGLWLVAIFGIVLLRPMPLARVARRLDVELGLKERLSTALMLEGWKRGRLEEKAGRGEAWRAEATSQPSGLPTFQPVLVALQHEDALAAARAIDPRQALPLRWLRRQLAVAGALIVIAGVLIGFPNPMDQILAERAIVAQAAAEQAERVEELREEIENAETLSPEEREALARQLEALAEQLRANPGDREEALADFSRLEEALRRQLRPDWAAQQEALNALSVQLRSLAEQQGADPAELGDAAATLEELAELLASMDGAEQEALAQTLAQLAGQAGQAGQAELAQALAAMAQSASTGDSSAASNAAQNAASALARSQADLDAQARLQQTLDQLQAGRQAMAGTGQPQSGMAAAQGQTPGQGNRPGSGQSGGGGGTRAQTLPPNTASGQADRPQGPGRPGGEADLDQQIYVPWERRGGNGEELTISGQDTGQGETEIREQPNPLPGVSSAPLVPYQDVYYEYLDSANQAMERSAIPPGLEDYVREYFTQLEP